KKNSAAANRSRNAGTIRTQKSPSGRADGNETLKSPAAANKNVDAVAIFVVMRHPNRARTRRTRPMSAFPNPMSAPHPRSANPNKSRTGRSHDDFVGWRWRRRFGDDDFLARR